VNSEGEQSILRSDDLDWLDEGICHSDKSGGDDSDDDDSDDGDGGGDDNNGGNNDAGGGTYGVGKNQRDGAMSWDSSYYFTQYTDHGSRPGISQQRILLDKLVDLSYNDDYSSRHNNYLQGYHSLEDYMHGLCLISGQYYGVGYGYVHEPQLERSVSTSISRYYNCA